MVERRLVPNPHEQGALGLALKLRAAGKSYRHISEAWVTGCRCQGSPRNRSSAFWIVLRRLKLSNRGFEFVAASAAHRQARRRTTGRRCGFVSLGEAWSRAAVTVMLQRALADPPARDYADGGLIEPASRATNSVATSADSASARPGQCRQCQCLCGQRKRASASAPPCRQALARRGGRGQRKWGTPPTHAHCKARTVPWRGPSHLARPRRAFL